MDAKREIKAAIRFYERNGWDWLSGVEFIARKATEMKRIRRLFAFLFTHDFDVVQDATAEVTKKLGRFTTVLKCRSCGEVYEYPTLNRDVFVYLYRMRGCKGKTT